MTAPKYNIIQFKAFGDLVIATEAVRRLSAQHRKLFQFVIGEHLIPLFEALDVGIPVIPIRHGEQSTLPRLFTLKKDGIGKAAGSALGLRKAVARLNLPGNVPAIMDRAKFRERLVTPGLTRIEIPKLDNIYLSFDKLMSDLGLEHRPVAPVASTGHAVRIFPGSRVAAKNLPIPLLRNIYTAISQQGHAAEIMLLDGERPDVEESGLPFHIVPKNFTSMISAVRGGDSIISADSMPAHIAEYVEKRVFVFSPVPNRYYYPRSVYLNGRDSLFQDGQDSIQFRKFLS